MYSKPSEKYTYSTYQYQCNRPKCYHRYQSNLCDPNQDHLPITMPNPNQGLRPPRLSSNEDKIIYDLKYGSQSCDVPPSYCKCQEY